MRPRRNYRLKREGEERRYLFAAFSRGRLLRRTPLPLGQLRRTQSWRRYPTGYLY
jgi:hypothetical protein